MQRSSKTEHAVVFLKGQPRRNSDSRRAPHRKSSASSGLRGRQPRRRQLSLELLQSRLHRRLDGGLTQHDRGHHEGQVEEHAVCGGAQLERDKIRLLAKVDDEGGNVHIVHRPLAEVPDGCVAPPVDSGEGQQLDGDAEQHRDGWDDDDGDGHVHGKQGGDFSDRGRRLMGDLVKRDRQPVLLHPNNLAETDAGATAGTMRGGVSGRSEDGGWTTVSK